MEESNRDDLEQRLITLSVLEAVILYKKCSGTKFRSLREQLKIRQDDLERSVSNIYLKLGFPIGKQLPSRVREGMLKEKVCPLFLDLFNSLPGDDYIKKAQHWPPLMMKAPEPKSGKSDPVVPPVRLLPPPPTPGQLMIVRRELMNWEHREETGDDWGDREVNWGDGELIRGDGEVRPPLVPVPVSNNGGTSCGTYALLALILALGGFLYWDLFVRAPKTVTINQTQVVTQIVLAPTNTLAPTATLAPTTAPQIVVVTATFPPVTDTPSPIPSPTITLTPEPFGNAQVAAFNADGSPRTEGGEIDLFPKVLAGADGQMHGDPSQKLVVQVDKVTSFANFVRIPSIAYVVCMNQAGYNGWAGGVMTVTAGITTTYTVHWPSSITINKGTCKL